MTGLTCIHIQVINQSKCSFENQVKKNQKKNHFTGKRQFSN